MSVARPLARLRLLTGRLHNLRPRAAGFASMPIPRLAPSSPRPLPPSSPPPKSTSVRQTPRSEQPYTAAELKHLEAHFSPEQLAALLAAEKAIDAGDLARKTARRRGDPFALPYLDDLSTIDPIVDFVPPELAASVHVPPHGIPGTRDPELDYLTDSEDPEGAAFAKLAQRTGMSVATLRNLRTRLMVSHSVTNQTRMGKIRKIYALAVAGNGQGLLGVGEGKSVESEDAIRQATYMAMRNMEPIPRFEARTIFGDVVVKLGAVEMKVFSRPPGTSCPYPPVSACVEWCRC